MGAAAGWARQIEGAVAQLQRRMPVFISDGDCKRGGEEVLRFVQQLLRHPQLSPSERLFHNKGRVRMGMIVN